MKRDGTIRRRRKEESMQRKECIRTGDWDEVLQILAIEDNPDMNFYKDRLQKVGISLKMLRKWR